MIRRAAAALAATAAVALTAAGCAGGAIGQNTALSNGQSFVSGTGTSFLAAGQPAAGPDISGKTLTGSRLSLSDYRGSVVVINFWGSWCAPCRAEAPDLSALASRYRSLGVRFLGIDIQDEPASAEAFMHTFRISLPQPERPGGRDRAGVPQDGAAGGDSDHAGDRPQRAHRRPDRRRGNVQRPQGADRRVLGSHAVAAGASQ